MKKLIVLAFFLPACGASNIGPTPVPTPPPKKSVPPPNFMHGWFVSSDGIVGRAEPGHTYVVVPSWGSSGGAVARELETKEAFAIVSAHGDLVFGHPEPTWAVRFDRLETEFLKAASDTGLLLGVYVEDEPLANGFPGGIPAVIRAIELVRSRGYKTMMAETWTSWRAKERWDRRRPPVDWFGVTAYYENWDLISKPDGGVADPSFDVIFADGQHYERDCSLAVRLNKQGCIGWSLDLGSTSEKIVVPRLE